MRLGQDGKQKIAIPDALYKIVIRGSGRSLKTLAFLIPNINPKAESELSKFLTSIDKIESLTGLDFLTALSESKQASVEKTMATEVNW